MKTPNNSRVEESNNSRLEQLAQNDNDLSYDIRSRS